MTVNRTRSDPYRAIRWASNPVESTASPTRLAVTKSIFMARPDGIRFAGVIRAGRVVAKTRGPARPCPKQRRAPPEGRGGRRSAMAERTYVPLGGRGVVTVGGSDRKPFLQGLISNDIDRATPDNAIWAALLTPQGKYLHDFFIAEIAGVFHLEDRKRVV